MSASHQALFAGYAPEAFIDIIRSLVLTTNLRLCLDAGDGVSYASGQSWLDRSGNGYDFFRGATSGSEGGDPTFNGSAGAFTSAEYFSFDGGDFFTYDSANETWMNNLHKDNALFTILAWVNIPLAGADGDANNLIGTRQATANIGSMLRFNRQSGTERLQHAMSNGSSSTSVISTTTVGTSAWSLVGVSLNEAGGAGASTFFVNGSTETFNGAYTSPSASNASFTMRIGTRGNADGEFLLNGSRIAMLSVWEGVVLTAAQVLSIFNATRGRFGI